MRAGKGRVRVKICGITNPEDAELAISLGADALGFNLYQGSKRRLDLQEAASWISALPPWVTRVAVVVNLPLAELLEVAAHPAIDSVQLHGDEDATYCEAVAQTGKPFVKALHLEKPFDTESLTQLRTRHVLLDAPAGSAYGGTGELLDTNLAADFVRLNPELRVILAGGLRAENVSVAIHAVRPYAVDVASGVEMKDAPRRKDPARLEAFFSAVRSAEQG